MSKQLWSSGDNCTTWEECKEWARIRLESRESMKLEDGPDDHYTAYLSDPNNGFRKIIWHDGSEAWDRLAMDAYRKTYDNEDAFTGSEAWSKWIDTHAVEYFADAYKGNEFEEIVLDVAREHARRLGIKDDDDLSYEDNEDTRDKVKKKTPQDRWQHGKVRMIRAKMFLTREDDREILAWWDKQPCKVDAFRRAMLAEINREKHRQT